MRMTGQATQTMRRLHGWAGRLHLGVDTEWMRPFAARSQDPQECGGGALVARRFVHRRTVGLRDPDRITRH